MSTTTRTSTLMSVFCRSVWKSSSRRSSALEFCSMSDFDLVIRNGVVALPAGAARVDIGIMAGKVAAVTDQGNLKGTEVLDASGMLVFPGAIDMHVHFREPGFEDKEDFLHGTAAAACGGVTTICDMPNTHPPVTSPDRFAEKLARVSKSAHVDFALWAGGVRIEHFAAMDELGAIGLKVYMNRALRAMEPYAGELAMPDDATFVKTLKAAAGLDWPVSVHVANSAIDEAAREDYQTSGSVDPMDVCCSFRSPESVEALSRAALFARLAGARLHIAHISLNALAALDALVEARNRGAKVTAEIVPPALSFEELPRLGAMGIPFAHAPGELDRYWNALAMGVIDVVATDHAPHTRAEKEAGRANPWKAPPGYPGVETSLPILVDAMLHNRISIEVLVKVMSENPARILGLESKGAILPGRDADLVLVDPEADWVVDETRLHSKSGWSPFQGRRLKGRLRLTMLRGNVIARDGEITAARPLGQQLRRMRPLNETESRIARGSTGQLRRLLRGGKTSKVPVTTSR
ncbi:MAG: hypothetical protein EXQ69_09020 [Acidimicrobiia bacterium]|nr:hypothetical protein [Acidimicrobiia bacterium]